MPKGYQGKILRVDLSTERIWCETPEPEFYRQYLGGWGMVAYYLLREVPAGTDPLGPDNRLIFATGLFTGVQLSGNGRSAIGAKSPLTGGFGEGDVGGYFAVELVRAGYDGLIVQGQASRPVYIWIEDEKVEMRDADHVWGKDSVETERALKKELDEPNARFAEIGPAGENQVLVSCILQDVHHAAGRTGLGAVMGSKKLKAVAVKGSGRKEIADPDPTRELSKWLLGEGKPRYLGLQDRGTADGVPSLSSGGGLPTKNFKLGDFEKADDISGQTMTETILKERGTCYACVVQCKRVVEVEVGTFETNPDYGGPEYETIGALGSNCGVGDLAAIAKGNEICNAQGLDTIGAGMMVSFAMECFEEGIITTEDTDGLELRFGNCEAMVSALEAMAERKGFGDVLAGGFKACIDKWGPEAEKFAIHVKWQALPMHEPRFKFALGLGYAISPTGADHVHNIHDTGFTTEVGMEGVMPFGILEPLPADDLSPAKVRLMKVVTDFSLLKNMLGMCLFLPFGPREATDIVEAVTGWNTSLFELMKGAERGMAMARAFNAREGFTPADDRLPERFYEPFASGPLEGVSHDREAFQAALETYYAMAGWDLATGEPTTSKYAELGLEWVAQNGDATA